MVRLGFGKAGRCGSVGLPRCLTSPIGDDVHASRIDTDRAGRGCQTLRPLPGTRPQLDREAAVQPEGTNGDHLSAAVHVQRREPRNE